MSHVHLVPRPRPAVQRELIASHGRRFGAFAALPIPDVDDCLTQIERATEIGLDGFMHLSRMAVRETIWQLEALGYVTIEPNRRTRVAPASRADFVEIFDMRLIAECLTIRRETPELSNARLDQAEAIQKQIEGAEWRAVRRAERSVSYDAVPRRTATAAVGTCGDAWQCSRPIPFDDPGGAVVPGEVRSRALRAAGSLPQPRYGGGGGLPDPPYRRRPRRSCAAGGVAERGWRDGTGWRAPGIPTASRNFQLSWPVSPVVINGSGVPLTLFRLVSLRAARRRVYRSRWLRGLATTETDI